MPKLEPPDTHFFAAAIGWLELGNPTEARLELKQISAEQRNNPDVLEVDWAICADQKNWSEGLAIAQTLVLQNPERSSGWLHQAYALRRVKDGGLSAAWEALLPAVEHFPKEPVIPFNLACYACQMKRLDEARQWLQRALAIGPKPEIKSMALADEDLKELWSEIQGM